MRDEIESYRRKGVQPFGVNPAGIENHAKYAAKLKLPFPLLSDPDRKVSAAYGTVKPDGKGIQRTVVLVERTGEVLFAARGSPGPDQTLAGL